MSEKERQQHFQLDGDAAVSLDDLVANAEAWDLPKDPAGIVSQAVLLLHAMHRNDLVFITRKQAEDLGLSEQPLPPVH